MPNKFAEVSSRSFNSTLAPGLPDEARKAVNAAFDAISTWRTETVNTSEKNLERVIDKMATAARALGWPEEIVDSTRAQMQGIIKMQIQMMDQIMDAWEQQIKSPSSSSAILSKLKSLPNVGAAGSWARLYHVANDCIQSLRNLHASRATMAKGMRGRDFLLVQSG